LQIYDDLVLKLAVVAAVAAAVAVAAPTNQFLPCANLQKRQTTWAISTIC
jgi:hypothetical protein